MTNVWFSPDTGRKRWRRLCKNRILTFQQSIRCTCFSFPWFLEPATFNDTFYYVARRSAPPLPVFSTLFLRSRISHSLSSPTFSKSLLFLLIYLPEKLNMDGYFFFFFAYVNFDLFLLLLFDNSRWALKNNETSINNWINTEFPWLKKCCLFSQLIRLFCALSTLINST